MVQRTTVDAVAKATAVCFEHRAKLVSMATADAVEFVQAKVDAFISPPSVVEALRAANINTLRQRPTAGNRGNTTRQVARILRRLIMELQTLDELCGDYREDLVILTDIIGGKSVKPEPQPDDAACEQQG